MIKIEKDGLEENIKEDILEEEEVYRLNSVSDGNDSYNTISYYLDDGLYFDPYTFKSTIRNPGSNSYALCELAERVYNENGFYSNHIANMMSGLDLIHIVSPLKREKEAVGLKEDFHDFIDEIELDASAEDMLIDTQKFGVYFGYLEYATKGDGASLYSLNPKYITIFGNDGKRAGIAVDLYKVITQDKQNLFPPSLRKRIKAAIGKISKGKNFPADGVYNDEHYTYFKNQYVRINNNRTIVIINGDTRRATWGQIPLIKTLDQLLTDYRLEKRKKDAYGKGGKYVLSGVLPGNDAKSSSVKSRTLKLSKTGAKQQHEAMKSVAESSKTINTLSVEPGTKLEVLKIEDMFASQDSKDSLGRIAFNGGVPLTILTGTAEGKAVEAYTKNALSVMYKNLVKFSREVSNVFHHYIGKEEKLVSLTYIKLNDYIKKDGFDMASKLFTEAGGSYEYMIASAGLKPREYINNMYEEREKGYDKIFTPHLSSNNISKDDEDVSGRKGKVEKSEK